MHNNSIEATGSPDERFARRTSRLEWFCRVLMATSLILCIILVIVDSFHEKKIEAAVLNFLQWVEGELSSSLLR